MQAKQVKIIKANQVTQHEQAVIERAQPRSIMPQVNTASIREAVEQKINSRQTQQSSARDAWSLLFAKS